MGQILVRNLDDAVIDALRRLAAASGTSTEEQARRALARAVGLDRAAAVERFAEIRRRIGKLPGPTSLELLREDRARDET
jgi:plasmid stability protein